MKSWMPQTRTKAATEFFGMGQRYETETEALAAAQDLKARWAEVEECRAIETPEPVTHVWQNGRAVSLVNGVPVL